MNVAASIAMLLLAAGYPAERPYDEEAYSDVERELDVAMENLVKAQTYICDDLRAEAGFTQPRRQYDAVSKRFFETETAAKQMLGRELNIRIWTNACRNRNPGRQFRSHLNKANRAIEAAEQLIAKGDQT